MRGLARRPTSVLSQGGIYAQAHNADGVLAPGTTAAQADSGLFYLGAGVTDSSLTASNNGYIAYGTPDLKNNSWKAFAGVHPLKWLALEADYIDLGSGSTSTLNNESTNTTHADSSAWVAYAIGFLPVPLPVVDFFGKVGVARWKLNSTLTQDFNNLFNTPPPPHCEQRSRGASALSVIFQPTRRASA